MKRLLCIVALGGVVLPASASASERAPALAIFHAGGFAFGGPALTHEVAVKARRRGFAAFNIDYPLFDIEAAVKTAVAKAQQLRRRGYRVFAYGDSAGGTLASLLAERGLADAAAAYAPPSDLLRWPDFFTDEEYKAWLGLNRAERRRLSPAFHRSKRPILVLQGHDGFAIWNLSWAKRDPLVRVRWVPGGHPDRLSPEYHVNTTLGLNWLLRQTKVAAR